MDAIVYSSSTCPYCKMVKDFLSQKGVSYEERNVSTNPAAAQELVSRTGQMGVPVTIINGQTIIGFDRTKLEQALSQRSRPVFGAAIADAGYITQKKGTGVILGAYIGNVRPGSVAQRVGLASGDIIIEVNLQPVTNADSLEKVLAKLSSGSRISVLYLRGNQNLTGEAVF